MWWVCVGGPRFFLKVRTAISDWMEWVNNKMVGTLQIYDQRYPPRLKSFPMGVPVAIELTQHQSTRWLGHSQQHALKTLWIIQSDNNWCEKWFRISFASHSSRLRLNHIQFWWANIHQFVSTFDRAHRRLFVRFSYQNHYPSSPNRFVHFVCVRHSIQLLGIIWNHSAPPLYNRMVGEC